MSDKVLPLKFGVFSCFANKREEPVNADQVYDLLKNQYGGEKQFTVERIQSYLDSFLAVGMIKDTHVTFRKNNSILVTYQITDLGRGRIKYLEK